LEYKLKYSPEIIDGMRYNVLVRRIDQYMKYKKAVSEAIASSVKNVTNK